MHKKICFGISTRKKFKRLNIKIPSGISIWKKVRLCHDIKIERDANFCKGRFLWSMGAYSYSFSELARNTIVGRYCSIGKNVTIMGFQHPLDRFTTSTITYSNSEFSTNNKHIVDCSTDSNEPICIKNDVWIAANVVLKPGVTIGNGAVIASNSVVTKDVPDYAIVGGIPAKIIKYRFPEETIRKLRALKWWDFNYLDFSSIPVDDPIELFIEKFIELRDRGEIKKYEPLYFNLV